MPARRLPDLGPRAGHRPCLDELVDAWPARPPVTGEARDDIALVVIRL
ncbi:hypothetical protein AB0M68_38880 [Streptomyces sp. NPDC051453]